jgi:hypothetical protein
VLNRRGRVVATGIVQMPHILPEGAVHPTRQSTELRCQLAAGRYSIRVSDYFNMSYLRANELYIDVGGRSGARNSADISALQLTRLP